MLHGATAHAGVEPEIELDPVFFYLGSFSTLDPLESDIIPGSTELRFVSVDPWQLELQLEGPIRRTTDGLELPLERLLDTHPEIPPEIVNLQPYIHDSGAGSQTARVISGDWLDLAMGLQAYLQPGDPPGTYEATLLARLLDDQGSPVTDHAQVTLEFDIAPWVHFIVKPLPDCEITVPEGGFVGESGIVLVTLGSNSDWILYVYALADLVRDGGSHTLPVTSLSVCSEEFSSRGGWRPRRSGCETVQMNPIALVVGSGPSPFTVAEEEIPIFVRFESAPPLPAGRYWTSLMFEATVDGFAP